MCRCTAESLTAGTCMPGLHVMWYHVEDERGQSASAYLHVYVERRSVRTLSYNVTAPGTTDAVRADAFAAALLVSALPPQDALSPLLVVCRPTLSSSLRFGATFVQACHAWVRWRMDSCINGAQHLDRAQAYASLFEPEFSVSFQFVPTRAFSRPCCMV